MSRLTNINKDIIIRQAQLKLGSQNQYFNYNSTEQERIASVLFDSVVRGLATDATFLFNSRRVFITRASDNKNDFGEYRYNKPNDYLSLVKISDRDARFEGEFIYSKKNEVWLAYCYELDLQEYPYYIEPLLVAMLAIRMAETYDGYAGLIPTLKMEESNLINTITSQEGLPFGIER